MGRSVRRVAVGVALGVLGTAGCSSGGSGEPVPTSPTLPPPTARSSAVDVPPSTGIAVTEEQLRVADPCILVDPATLAAYGEVRTDLGIYFSDCNATISPPGDAEIRLFVRFDRALAGRDPRTPTVRAGVTVYGSAGGETGCSRGIVVSRSAVINVTVAGRDRTVACPIADRAIDAMLPRLTAGDLPSAGMPRDSLANLDACALLRHDEVFQVRDIDKTQYTPGFDGQSCTWGGPLVTQPHVYLNLGPGFELNTPYLPRDRAIDIGGRAAVVAAEPGTGSGQDRTPPGCTVRIEYRPLARPGSAKTIEQLRLSVNAEAPDEANCQLATNLATAAVARLPG